LSETNRPKLAQTVSKDCFDKTNTILTPCWWVSWNRPTK